MAATLTHATPEHWTELIAARKQKQLCTKEIDAIKRSCQTNCGKNKVTECPDCYPKVLERMRRRYNQSEGREWFTQRKAFLQELDDLFADAKQHKIKVEDIEARIESEKEAWYRWVLRKYPEFLTICDNAAHQGELRDMLDDPDRSRDEVVGMVWQGIGKPQNWSEQLEAFTERVVAAGGNPIELKKLYMVEFFQDLSTGEIPEHTKPYLEELEKSETANLEEVIGKIARDTLASRSSQDQRNEYARRLDELQRAKTAQEHNREQAKRQAREVQEALSGGIFSDLPPCLVCKKSIDTKDIFSCTVCQAAAQMGGEKKLTLYCSEGCYEAGHDKHVEDDHDCDGQDNCAQLWDGEDDVVMGDDGISTKTFACKDCLDQKRMTVFCSERCALANIGAHRSKFHQTATPTEDAQSHVAPLADVLESVSKKHNPPGLTISGPL